MEIHFAPRHLLKTKSKLQHIHNSTDWLKPALAPCRQRDAVSRTSFSSPSLTHLPFHNEPLPSPPTPATSARTSAPPMPTFCLRHPGPGSGHGELASQLRPPSGTFSLNQGGNKSPSWGNRGAWELLLFCLNWNPLLVFFFSTPMKPFFLIDMLIFLFRDEHTSSIKR